MGYIDINTLRPHLLDYLYRLTGERGIKRGRWLQFHAPYRDDKTPSLSVSPDGTYWHDLGSDKRGSIVHLCQLVNNCDCYTALQILSGLYGNTPAPPQPAPPQPSRTGTEEDNPHKHYKFHILCNPVLFAYANDRGVDCDTMCQYCEEATEITPNGKGWHYYYIAMRTDNGGYELRNQYAKRTAQGAHKDITTLIDEGNPAVLLFEGMFDALSFLSNVANVPKIADVIILNSTTNINKAIEAAKQYNEVHCYLDNDEAGRNATATIKQAIPTAQDHAPRYANFNDVNDFICARLKQEGRLPRIGSSATKTANKH